eukprot:g11390.t1
MHFESFYLPCIYFAEYFVVPCLLCGLRTGSAIGFLSWNLKSTPQEDEVVPYKPRPKRKMGDDVKYFLMLILPACWTPTGDIKVS